ncbi:MAG: UDP-3-O-(3-hydroxymyristoyl)glucosamine N-acyltransferase [Ignavibacteriaceae bacterium]|jgi:UDP-3-O-[3-hydroxymyristoyl] glucosamine N-acyltransferase|nr:UDP-3-O-(3-hydroxymyristoyl)glucosamine N-acyltransferase [Ignavibacteriaceae bacterium]
MKISISEIASLTNGKISGDESVLINNVAKIEEAVQGDLTFLYLPAYEKFFPDTKASAIIVKTGFDKTRNDITYIECDSPNKAFFNIVRKYFTPKINISGIDTTAFIHPSAKLGKNVSVGKNVVVSAGCTVGDDSIILHNSTIMDNTRIGNNTVIYSNVSIRENCIIGNNVVIHNNSVIGSDGFGYSTNETGEYLKIPQIGNVIIEDDVEIGSNVSVDRAAFGSTIIKKGCKIDNLVQIAHNVVIGEHTAISAQSGISGSSKIGKHCILAGQVGLVDHIELADNVVITAQSGVSKSITKPGYYLGSPVRDLKTAQKLNAHVHNLPDYAQKIIELQGEIKKLKEKLG